MIIIALTIPFKDDPNNNLGKFKCCLPEKKNTYFIIKKERLLRDRMSSWKN